jgi:hypothetical protein
LVFDPYYPLNFDEFYLKIIMNSIGSLFLLVRLVFFVPVFDAISRSRRSMRAIMMIFGTSFSERALGHIVIFNGISRLCQ